MAADLDGADGEAGVRASVIATAIMIRVSVIAALLTWWLAIQVASGWLNQCAAPIEKQLRAAITAIHGAA